MTGALVTCFAAELSSQKSERGLSSAGEHMTEDHGVLGSTPRGPIYFKKFYKQVLINLIMKKKVEEKKEKEVGKKERKIKGNGLGASGFTLGILSVLSLGIFGILMSIVGFIFCFIQQKNKPTKLGKVGLIINIIGFILSIVWIFYFAPILTEQIQQLVFPT